MEFILRIILFVLLVICFITDVRKNKIYNLVLLPFILLGLVLNFVFYGTSSGISSMLGGIVPIVLFAPFFIMRMFGAGDIKLFSTIGFLMGLRFCLNNIIYSFIAALFISLIIIMVRKNFFKRIRYFFQFFLNIILTQNVSEYEKGNGKFPFATAIFLGAVLQVITKYEFLSFYK